MNRTGRSTEYRMTRIMVVDDTPANLGLLHGLLTERGYQVLAFTRADIALKAARRETPDLIMVDINMPVMNGYEMCMQLKADENLKEIPVIFISALNEALDKVKAFQIGAVDYVTKPFQIEELHARVETHLRIRKLQIELETINKELENRVQEQVKEISDAQMATILALANLAESRDDVTGNHLHRVQSFARMLARQMNNYGEYKAVTGPSFERDIYYASALHDIGKVGIADSILLKPGKLDPDEFEVMKTHTSIGFRTLQAVHRQYGRNALIVMGMDVTRYHHERWDGQGYPDGLAGEQIPLCARIMALADVYDALRSERCYKKAIPVQETRMIIVKGSGTQFDPAVVQAFTEVEDEFAAIMEEYL